MHNQRIERLWRDLFNGCIGYFYKLFYSLEDDLKLDVNNRFHLYCLHFVFKPRINRSISDLRSAWCKHKLRTTGMTPEQMFLVANTVETVPLDNVSNNILLDQLT